MLNQLLLCSEWTSPPVHQIIYLCIEINIKYTLKFRKIHLILLCLFSGSLLSLGWPERGFPGLLFIGFVPLLIVEEQIYRHPERFIKFSALFYAYPGFFLWNLLTTWWIVNSTFTGALMAIVINSLFMAIVFQGFHWIRKKLNSPVAGYASLLAYWVAFEYLHLNWDLNWPWLNLGNGFATYYKWVQWYEYTGALGGTVWVLVANILVFSLVDNWQNAKCKVQSANEAPNIQNSKFVIQYSIFIFSWIVLPIAFSYYSYATYTEQKNPVNIVVVQPNIDPYNEQYNLPPQAVIGRIMSLAAASLDSTTNFLVAPESSIQEDMWENELSRFTSMRMLQQAISPYPRLNMLIGASTHYQLAPDEPLERWARKFTDTDGHYYAYNTAILLNNRDSLQLYHKSKLTPGVEILPSFKGFKWLENFAIDLGGTTGSLGMDSGPKVYSTVNTIRVAPAICYESIFGEFFTGFVREGAQIMFIITNDGWWGKTAGHRQHYTFAHLRAIETRRSIARSANTGISAFINQRGDEHQETAYWVPAVIKGTLNANDKITFYVKHGDYIARFLSYLAGGLILAAIGMSVKYKFFKSRLRA